MEHLTTKPMTSNEYYDAVKSIADVIEERAEDKGEVSDLIHQQVDSSQYIIYYSKNLTVLEESQKEPAEWNHLVSDSDSWREVIQAMAYDTMRRDVREELRNRDLL